jgi:Skp family chaperone for outer membrane proteins
MKGLVRTGSVLVVLAALVFVSRSWSEPQKPPPAPRTRIALVNLSYVVKNYERFKSFQAEMKEQVEKYQKRDKELGAEVERLAKEATGPDDTAERREEIEKQTRKLMREREENSLEAKKLISKKSDEQVIGLYKDVRRAAEKYAKAHDFEIVLHYNDAIDDADLDSAPNVMRKMQAGAAMPLYVAPGLDISREIVAALNAALRET